MKIPSLTWLLTAPAISAAPHTATNSLGWGADPAVLHHDGLYYGSITGNYGKDGTAALRLYRADNLEDLFRSRPRLIPLSRETAGEEDALWAPDLRHFDGRTYLYFFNHTTASMHVLVSDGVDAFGPYSESKLVFPADWEGGPGYDWTVFRRSDGSYWGFFARGTGCWVAAMSSPTTISRPAVRLSGPAREGWERLDNELNGCNEAPQVIAFPDPQQPGNERIFLTYSANSYKGDDYSLGMLAFQGTGHVPLDQARSWKKHQENKAPVFRKGNGIVSTGHNAMVEAPNGTWWNFYHARYLRSGRCGRQLRLQPIDITSGTPKFGSPIPEGALLHIDDGSPTTSSGWLGIGTHDDRSRHIFYSRSRPGWTNVRMPEAFGGGVTRTNAEHAYVLCRIDGGEVRLHAPTGPAFGTAAIYIDGDHLRDVNLHAATPGPSTEILRHRFPDSGRHTVMLVNLPPIAEEPGKGRFLAVDRIVVVE